MGDSRADALPWIVLSSCKLLELSHAGKCNVFHYTPDIPYR